jgi:hypothetical protein
MNPAARLAIAFVSLLAVAAPAGAGELRGSPRSMRRQHDVAVAESFAFAATPAQLRRLIAAGQLVAVEGNADYVVHGQVPHRFARPEVLMLIERLAAQFHAATGRQLVVTSLVRPSSEQPPNAHPLSVHPVGMAMDLRVPAIARDRAWLERALLGLENDGVLDVTRERRPPHYHVAVFPEEYRAYVARRDSVAAPTTVAVPTPAAALASVAPDHETAADASDRPITSRAPVTLAGLAFGGLLFGVVRVERRRSQRRRTSRPAQVERRN